MDMPVGSVMAIAHRGASAYAPENTLAAFEHALRLGAQAVEFDVRLSADRVPVVLHDATLERTTNGRGPVGGLTLKELQRLDAGAWYGPAFAGQRIPTLAEALSALGTARSIIELKDAIDPRELIGTLDRQQALERAAVISFEPALLAPLRQASRALQIGLLAEHWDQRLPERAQAMGAAVLILAVEILAPARVQAAEEAGLELWTYTANDVGLVAACAAMGATGIITDQPDLIRTKRV
jgi:glycerophosphoryl diester phosphodiesterase